MKKFKIGILALAVMGAITAFIAYAANKLPDVFDGDTAFDLDEEEDLF